MMGLSASQQARVPRHPSFKNRGLRLIGAIVFAVVLPGLLRWALGVREDELQLIVNSSAANLIAVLLGYYFYRSIIIYPGIQASYFILPSLFLSYAGVAFSMLILRLEYNRSVLLGSFVAAVIWLFAVELAPGRRRALKIGIVPFGQIDGLQGIPNIRCHRLAHPNAAAASSLDLIVADLRAEIPDEWERFIADATLEGQLVLHVKSLCEALTGRVEIDHLSENSFGSLVPLSAYMRIKRLLDFATAAAALILLAPVFLVTALVIRLDSRGPALFRQTRVGYGGHDFTVLKFRTMRHGQANPTDRSAAMTGDNDPRITRIGHFLRRSRIDELPQLVNVLRGDMSLIGPRPEAHVLSKWYESELPFYRYRHVVRPGITGWAQVNQGHVADVDEVLGKLHYDFYYIRNFSPWLDALIFARTIQTVFTGFGAR